ncbi:MAG: ribonuclease D [Candidatus Paracaedibacteraceae bacterium]|nr:ribonuclease D [Candidatus Paracaedibacteraceae bacterium]
MTFQLIKSSEIKYWCDKFSAQTDIAIDTEFSRVTTYWPKLALIQLSDGIDTVLIDPLEKGRDLSPLDDLLANPDVVKIFHSCRQDLEVLNKVFGRLPVNLFDTQLAYTFLHPADEISLARLLEEYAGVILNKSKQNSNWMRRPLPRSQLEYAAKDVFYLTGVKQKLESELIARNRLSWFYEEQHHLYIPETFEPVDDYWQRLAKRGNHKPQQLHYLKGLCDWREKMAIKLDYNRRRVLSDDVILKIAETSELFVEDNEVVDDVLASLVSTWSDLQQVPEVNWPKRLKHRAMTIKQQEKLETIRLKLSEVANNLGVSEKLLASTADLKAFVRGEPDIPFLKGWRSQVLSQSGFFKI